MRPAHPLVFLVLYLDLGTPVLVKLILKTIDDGKGSSAGYSQFKALKAIAEIDWLMGSEGMHSQKFRDNYFFSETCVNMLSTEGLGSCRI